MKTILKFFLHLSFLIRRDWLIKYRSEQMNSPSNFTDRFCRWHKKQELRKKAAEMQLIFCSLVSRWMYNFFSKNVSKTHIIQMQKKFEEREKKLMKFHFDPTCMLEPSIYRFVMYSNARLGLKKRRKSSSKSIILYFVLSFIHSHLKIHKTILCLHT